MSNKQKSPLEAGRNGQEDFLELAASRRNTVLSGSDRVYFGAMAVDKHLVDEMQRSLSQEQADNQATETVDTSDAATIAGAAITASLEGETVESSNDESTFLAEDDLSDNQNFVEQLGAEA